MSRARQNLSLETARGMLAHVAVLRKDAKAHPLFAAHDTAVTQEARDYVFSDPSR